MNVLVIKIIVQHKNTAIEREYQVKCVVVIKNTGVYPFLTKVGKFLPAQSMLLSDITAPQAATGEVQIKHQFLQVGTVTC